MAPILTNKDISELSYKIPGPKPWLFLPNLVTCILISLFHGILTKEWHFSSFTSMNWTDNWEMTQGLL